MGDILFAVFKHKWKILVGALIGFLAAFAVLTFYAPVYESHAKLLVRYAWNGHRLIQSTLVPARARTT